MKHVLTGLLTVFLVACIGEPVPKEITRMRTRVVLSLLGCLASAGRHAASARAAHASA